MKDRDDKHIRIESFNDVTEHNHRIIGHPTKKADVKNMPKPIRWFYYFITFFMVFALLSMILVAIFK